MPLYDSVPLAYSDLVPNTTYVSPGFEYLTDGYALPARVRGSLRIVRPADRVRHPEMQAEVGRLVVEETIGHQGGHLIAVSLGGFASGPNLFPQAHNFNISAYARLEHGWRRALKGGETVEVDIALTLDNDPNVPQFLVVTYWENAEEWEQVLLNEPNVQ